MHKIKAEERKKTTLLSRKEYISVQREGVAACIMEQF